jgi:hypothetical protein
MQPANRASAGRNRLYSGWRRGHFQNTLPPSKLKIVPHRRSKYTGTTGTFARPYRTGTGRTGAIRRGSLYLFRGWQANPNSIFGDGVLSTD